MNWNTVGYVGKNAERIKKLIEQDSACDHVLADNSLAYTIRRENDSFGTVGSCVCCKACDEAADIADKKAAEEEYHTCVDCKEVKQGKDGILWKFWDHSDSQGDTPLFVCKCCQVGPTHQNRVIRDKQDYDAEMRDLCGDDE